MARLRAELPAALRNIPSRAGGHGAGGAGPRHGRLRRLRPGAGTRRHADDRTHGIALINGTYDEISSEGASGYDPETCFCIDRFETFGVTEGDSGDAMARAYNIAIEALADAFAARGGTARLPRRDELPADWNLAADLHLIRRECAQHLARVRWRRPMAASRRQRGC